MMRNVDQKESMSLENYKIFENVIENIQEVIVSAGGCFHRRDKIKSMTVEELVGMLLPNGVVFDIRLERNHQINVTPGELSSYEGLPPIEEYRVKKSILVAALKYMQGIYQESNSEDSIELAEHSGQFPAVYYGIKNILGE